MRRFIAILANNFQWHCVVHMHIHLEVFDGGILKRLSLPSVRNNAHKPEIRNTIIRAIIFHVLTSSAYHVPLCSLLVS